MEINIDKTECMHVQHQQRVVTPNQTRRSREGVCAQVENEGCGCMFGNKLGLKLHQVSWCQWSRYYKVENSVPQVQRVSTWILQNKFW